VDGVHHTRDLGLAPALGDVQVADDVGPTLAAVGYAGRVKAADRALVAAAWGGKPRAAARRAVRARALRREGGGEAAAERGGVGHQVRLVEALLVGGEEVRPVVAAAGERIERSGFTGGDAGPGQVARVEVSVAADGIEAVGVLGVEVEMADQGPVGGVRREVEAEVGPG